jgi:hypothetical protein
VRLAQDRDAVAKSDPSEAKKLQGRIDGASSEQERLRVRAVQDVQLANQEEAASFKAISDQVVNYRANLLQLSGDEIGAAKLRAQQTIEQASILSRQTAGGVDTAALQSTLQQNIEVQRSRQESNRITETLQIEEERIALQLQRGSITEYDALQRVGAARRQTIAGLEAQVVAQEKVAASRPKDAEGRFIDVEFQLNTERARLELDKLKDALDPLADKFDSLFRDSGADAIADFLNGTKTAQAAIQDFGKSILTQINGDIARNASDALFGKGGVFGGAGGIMSTIFGGKPGEAGKPGDAKGGSVTVGPLNTSAVEQSLTNLQTTGIAPTTNALVQLQQAANAAAGALSPAVVQGAAIPPAAIPAVVAALPTTGDLARADRAAETPAEAAAESAQALSTSLVATQTATRQFASVLAPAAGIVAGMGQAGAVAASALSLLPAIVQAFAVSTSASSASSSGGSIFSSLGSLFSGGSGSAPSTGDFARMDRGGSSGGGFFATAASFFSSFFHTGGVVGQKQDMRAVNPGVFEGAGKMHSGGIVGGEALASLKANEVPAILLGGPRGVREEVLTASDPRHKDNLSPVLLKTIQDAQGNPASVLSVIASGGKGGDGGAGGSAVAGMLKHEQATRELSPLTRFLIGSPETVQGLVSELSKEADFEGVSALRDIKRVAGARELGGAVSPNSLYRVNERKPELLEVAGKQYLMTGGHGGEVKQQPEKERALPPIVLNQHFAPGTDRRTINQAAAAGGAAVQTALVRFG